MKRGVLPLSIILIALFCCGAQASAPYDGGRFPQRENTTRIMSFNIQHGRGMDGKVNIERIGKVILEVNPEVVGLQEVDSMINRSGNTDIIRMLS